MENFTFCTPTQYIFGRDAEKNAGEMSARYLGKNVMVVVGKGSAVRSGLLERVVKSLADAGVASVELHGVQPNPVDTLVYEGIAVARDSGVTGILAVGGGSVIDTAKAIAAGVPYEGDFWDFYNGKAKLVTALPVGVVLTIPAAGSEGSGNTVITRTPAMQKVSLRAPEILRPQFALMNPELTFSLPAYQTSAGIVDMMAHIMERYFSPTPGVEVTDRLAEGLLKAIMNEAHVVHKHPCDYDARANIMWAGTLAHNGVCGTGRVEDWMSHAMEHELSAAYGVTHGAGLAVVFPAWMTFAARRKPEKIAQFARRVMNVADTGDDTADALEGVARLKHFFRSIGMPVDLHTLGIDNPDINRLVDGLTAIKGKNPGGYIKLTGDDIARIYMLML